MNTQQLFDHFKTTFESVMAHYSPDIDPDFEVLNDEENAESVGVTTAVTLPNGVDLEAYFQVFQERGEALVCINENGDGVPLSKEVFVEFYMLEAGYQLSIERQQ
jgi:hypothetical protein